jgi:hypothetical protein
MPRDKEEPGCPDNRGMFPPPQLCTTIRQNLVFLARFHPDVDVRKGDREMREMVEMTDPSTTLHPSPSSPLIPISPFLLSIFLLAAMSRGVIRKIRG